MATDNSVTNNRKRAEIDDYLKHWPKGSTPKGDIDEGGRHGRVGHYKDMVIDFYDNATDFELEGWGQSIHFCRFPRGREPMVFAMARHEHYMANRLGLKEGMTVLDVGCGVGGPAKEIATFVGCKVIGLNVNAYQLQKGREFAKKEGIGEDVVDFVEGDFMKMPFPDNSFDAIYAMEATVHAPSLAGVYSEIHRVLKPGGRFGVYEWVMLDTFDPSVPRHLYIRHGLERGNGIACMRTAAEARAAMKEAGFLLEYAENIGDKKDPLPWWYVASGDTQFAYGWTDWARVVRMTAVGRVLLDVVIRGLEVTRIARKGSAKMAKELIHGGDSIAEGGKMGIFTPMYLMLGIKSDKSE